MIIVGNRGSYAKTLASYLLSKEDNEATVIREISNYPGNQQTPQNLGNALHLMDTQALAKGHTRTLYHAVLALRAGETLTDAQLKYAIETLTANLKLTGHQRVVVEHRKAGRQHFHIVYNMLDPVTGKIAWLSFSKLVSQRTARELKRQFGFQEVEPKGRSIRLWEHRRGQRSGIDPLLMRKEVTALYNKCKTGAEFREALAKAGYILTIGKYKSCVLIDRAGHIHGLMSRIEGTHLSDLQRKFPDLKKLILPSMTEALQQQRAGTFRQKTTGTFRGATETIRRRHIHYKVASGSVALPLPRQSRLAQLMARTARTSAQEKARLMKESTTFLRRKRRPKIYENEPPQPNFNKEEIERAELIAWAFENGRFDILAQFGIHMEQENFQN